MTRPTVLEPPQRSWIAADPMTDRVVEAVRRWHDDERHEGVFEFCTERPCGDVLEVLG